MAEAFNTLPSYPVTKLYSEKQFRFVCELIWGCVPVDREWAMGTPIFREKAPQLLEQYPLLDESFFKR